MRSRWTRVATAGAVLLVAGCGSATTAQVEQTRLSRAATSSYLRNNSDMPITYSPLDQNRNVTLAPHTEVVNAGGAWMVPVGVVCKWTNDEGTESLSSGGEPYAVWTMFTGYRQVIQHCSPST